MTFPVHRRSRTGLRTALLGAVLLVAVAVGAVPMAVVAAGPVRTR